MKRTVTEIRRAPFMQSYKENMVTMLQSSTGCSRDEAMDHVSAQVAANFKDRRIRMVHNPANGVANVKEDSLSKFIATYGRDVIVPSGSVYKPAHKEKAMTSKWTEDGIKERKTVKKKQFHCDENGDTLMAQVYKYSQNTIKVRLNSLPGGFGSPFNIFYCKPGYNAITSSARSLIANAYTTAEQLLGGNFAWFTEQEAINFIVQCIRKAPAASQIEAMMSSYRVRHISKQECFDWVAATVRQYDRRCKFTKLSMLFTNLEDHVVQFLYYNNNLRNLIWGNDSVFRPWIKDLMAYSNHDDTSINMEDYFKIDGDLIPLVLTLVTNELGNVKAGDLGKKHPRETRLCIRVASALQSKLDALAPLMETFIYTNILTPNVLTRKSMLRNTVVVSDTDSVIFTASAWVEWYVGHIDKIVSDSFDISALATYWLTKVNSDTMAKYSISLGAVGDNVKTMQMKNEYLYPALMIYETKKTYAGIIKIHEGVILPEVRPDIKGAALRSSTIAKDSSKFSENLIIEQIIKPVTEGSISAAKLINLVVDFENKIRASLEAGELTFLPMQSIGFENEYANPESSPWMYGKAWNEVFGEAYGVIHPPDKVPMVKLLQISPGYHEWLQEKNPEIAHKLVRYMSNKKKMTAIVVNALNRRIPEELIPLINIRHIIYTNLKPAYLTLESLGIAIGHDKMQMLFSDIIFDHQIAAS